MEVKITKKQMKEMIKKHYLELGFRDLSVRLRFEKKIERDFILEKLDCRINHIIIVDGKIENEGVWHTFSEELPIEKIEEMVIANFEEKYDVFGVDFDDDVRPSLLSAAGVVPYCKGLVVTIGQKKKNTGKYIVKK